MYSLSYYHHQIGSMDYYPLFRVGHETIVCAVCLSMFLVKGATCVITKDMTLRNMDYHLHGFNLK